MAEEGIDHSMILAEVIALVDTHRRTPRLHLNCGSDTVTVLGVTGDRVCQRDGRPARCAAMRRSCVATVCVHVRHADLTWQGWLAGAPPSALQVGDPHWLMCVCICPCCIDPQGRRPPACIQHPSL